MSDRIRAGAGQFLKLKFIFLKLSYALWSPKLDDRPLGRPKPSPTFKVRLQVLQTLTMCILRIVAGVFSDGRPLKTWHPTNINKLSY